jgi:colanic acid biosynthesis glycosyl transferase WcaI
VSRTNAFALEHKLLDEFVVLYAGNVGLSQGLEHVVVAAERLATEPDMRMVFVGDGAGRSALEAEAVRHPAAQVTSLPLQPRSRLAEVLGTADISLVCLKRGVGTGSVPSKTLSILASGRPLVASVDEGSDTRRLVEAAGAGLCVPPEDPSALAEAILALRRDPKRRADMGSAAARMPFVIIRSR